MTEQYQLTLDSEVCKTLTVLPEKFVVDFANGIDVTRDHLHVQRQRTGFKARLFDGLTGQGGRRQIEINESLADGVKGAFICLCELSESLTKTNLAAEKINQRVFMLRNQLTQLANYSADTRLQLEDFAYRISERCDRLTVDVNRIDFEQRAGRNLDQVFNKWSAGRFNSFSLAERCFVAIEELYWGDFGDYCRKNQNQIRSNFLEDMVNRSVSQLKKDSGYSHSDRIELKFWLEYPSDRQNVSDLPDALEYLGDWSDVEEHPFVFASTQRTCELPLALPRLFNAERMSEALVSEVFERTLP